MNKKRVAVYARVSTKEESQALSFKTQKSYYEAYVKANPEWELIKIYADRGISGTYLGTKREQFNELMKDCGLEVVDNKKEFSVIETDNPSKYDLIIVKDEKRFSRNVDINAVIKRLKNKKVGVFFETLGINTLEKDDATLKILFAMSEDFSKNLSKNLKISYERAHLKNPMILGHYAPFGYQFGRNENDERTLKPIDESYIKIINDIFDMYINGDGFRVIAKYVNEKGFKTTEGKQIEKYTIERIIKNEKYMGYIQVIRHTAESINTYGHTLRKYMNYDLIKSNKIIPMVSEEKWKQANNKLSSKPISENSRGIKYSKSKYCNKLLCLQCGGNYNKTKDSKGNIVYVCSSKREKLGNADMCKSPYVSEAFLDEFLSKLLKDDSFRKTERMRIEDIINYFLFYKYALIATFFSNRDLELIEDLKSKVNKLNEQQDFIFSQFQDLPADVIKRKINAIEEEKAVYQKQLDREEFTFENFKKDIKTIESGVDKLRTFKLDNVKTESDLLDKIEILIKPLNPDSKIRQKRNDCRLDFRSIYADEYQEMEFSYLNNLSLSPSKEIEKRIMDNVPFSDEEKAELDSKLKSIM